MSLFTNEPNEQTFLSYSLHRSDKNNISGYGTRITDVLFFFALLVNKIVRALMIHSGRRLLLAAIVGVAAARASTGPSSFLYETGYDLLINKYI